MEGLGCNRNNVTRKSDRQSFVQEQYPGMRLESTPHGVCGTHGHRKARFIHQRPAIRFYLYNYLWVVMLHHGLLFKGVPGPLWPP